MPIKKLIIAGTVLLLVALMIWANVADSPTEGVSGDAPVALVLFGHQRQYEIP